MIHKPHDIKKMAEQLRSRILIYQYCVCALRTTLTSEHNLALPESLIGIGNVDIWPCKDGAVALFYNDAAARPSVTIRAFSNITTNEFMSTNDAMRLFHENGLRTETRVGMTAKVALPGDYFFGGIQVPAQDGSVLSHKFDKAMVHAWNSTARNPDEWAVDDFRAVYIYKNFSKGPVDDRTVPDLKQVIARIADEFEALLNTANKEEELQQYLLKRPEIMYPDYIELHPKLKLGSDHVTDFAFLIQGQAGREHIFVEIESASKPIFTKAGLFSSEFTQAKDQLITWDNWISEHLHYIRASLPGLARPKYHLIMGRDASLSEELRHKLRSEFASGSRLFSTYDDILKRFRQIGSRISIL